MLPDFQNYPPATSNSAPNNYQQSGVLLDGGMRTYASLQANNSISITPSSSIRMDYQQTPFYPSGTSYAWSSQSESNSFQNTSFNLLGMNYQQPPTHSSERTPVWSQSSSVNMNCGQSSQTTNSARYPLNQPSNEKQFKTDHLRVSSSTSCTSESDKSLIYYQSRRKLTLSPALADLAKPDSPKNHPVDNEYFMFAQPISTSPSVHYQITAESIYSHLQPPVAHSQSRKKFKSYPASSFYKPQPAHFNSSNQLRNSDTSGEQNNKVRRDESSLTNQFLRQFILSRLKPESEESHTVQRDPRFLDYKLDYSPPQVNSLRDPRLSSKHVKHFSNNQNSTTNTYLAHTQPNSHTAHSHDTKSHSSSHDSAPLCLKTWMEPSIKRFPKIPLKTKQKSPSSSSKCSRMSDDVKRQTLSHLEDTLDSIINQHVQNNHGSTTLTLENQSKQVFNNAPVSNPSEKDDILNLLKSRQAMTEGDLLPIPENYDEKITDIYFKKSIAESDLKIEGLASSDPSFQNSHSVSTSHLNHSAKRKKKHTKLNSSPILNPENGCVDTFDDGQKSPAISPFLLDQEKPMKKKVHRNKSSKLATTASEPKPTVHDVIIVGAGIAGLAAAQVLRRRGFRCVVLEARERHGGRIHTVSVTPPNDETVTASTILELGANYIHGCVNDQWAQPMFVMASRLGVTTAIAHGDVDIPYRGWENPEVAVWRDHLTGKLIPDSEIASMTYLFDATVEKASGKLEKLNMPHTQPLRPVFEEVMQSLVKDMYCARLRKTKTLTVRERGIFDSLTSRYLAYVNPIDRLKATLKDDPKNLDTSRIDDEEEPGQIDSPLSLRSNVSSRSFPDWKKYYLNVWQKKWKLIKSRGPQSEVAKRVHRKWEDRLVLGGYSAITDKLAEGLDIRYNVVVRRVDWSSVDTTTAGNRIDANISIDYDDQINENILDRILCRHCVIAVPVGVLKGLHPSSRMEFSPALPEMKQSAIDQLGIPFVGAETHDKIILGFETKDIFWDRDTPQLKCPDTRLHILNLDWYGHTGILLSHVWGGSGLKLFGRTDTEIVDELMTLLSGMYPAEAVNVRPQWAIVTRWSEDPFTLGSYTEGEIGSSDIDRNAYAASLPSAEEPRLLFAGEGTVDSSRGQQCTHGAFMSGVDRACDIIRHVSKGGVCGVPISSIVDFLLEDTSVVKRRRSSSKKSVPDKDVSLEEKTSVDPVMETSSIDLSLDLETRNRTLLPPVEQLDFKDPNSLFTGIS